MTFLRDTRPTLPPARAITFSLSLRFGLMSSGGMTMGW